MFFLATKRASQAVGLIFIIIIITFLSTSKLANTISIEDYQYISTLGRPGIDPGEFQYPNDIAIDSNHNIYVTDSKRRVQKFDSDGNFISLWGSDGSGDGQFKGSLFIDVDSNDNVYVADQGNNRIQKFDSSGNFISKWGSYGSGDGQFINLYGIAADTENNIYVSDGGNNRIQKFNSSGNFISKWGSYGSGDGQFALHSPQGIATDANDNVYAVDLNNFRLQIFDSYGTLINKWSSLGSFQCVEVDENFNVYLTILGSNHYIRKYDTSGNVITIIGGYGTGTGKFVTPQNVAISNQQLYVTDFFNNRVQLFAHDNIIPPTTSLSSNPTSFNGDNGWYKSTPIITLTPDESATTYFQWDTTEPLSWNQYLSPFVAISGSHTLNYYSVDSYNNTETIKSQAFDVKVDNTPPTDPDTISSPSHTVSQWSPDNTVEILFSGATDDTSGIDGYSVSWSQNNTDTPPTPISLQESASGTVSPPLADGKWWVNLSTKDNAGNWTTTAHYGPFWINAGPPTVNLQNNVNQYDHNASFSWQGSDFGDGPVSEYSFFLEGYDGDWTTWSSLTSFSYQDLPNGSYTFKVKARDPAGDESAVASFTFTKTVPDSFTFDGYVTWDSGFGQWDWNGNKIAVGDFNGDGFDDVASVYGYFSQRLTRAFVWLNDGSGTFQQPTIWWDSGPGNWDWAGSMLESGDFNGDGMTDLAILYGYAAQRDVRIFAFLSNKSNFNVREWWHAGPGNWDWAGSKLTGGNFDGDGDDDLAVVYGYAAERDVRAFVFKSSGTNFNVASWWQAGRNNWDWAGNKLTSGDFTGDGITDMAILYGYAAERDVKIFILPSNGSQFTGTQQWWQAGAGNWDWSGSKLSSGDFTGSIQDDIVMLYGYSPMACRLWGLTSKGNSFGSPFDMWFSPYGDIDWNTADIFAGDFFGDGMNEPLVFSGYDDALTLLITFIPN